MQRIRKNSTVPKASAEDEASLDCEARFSFKLKKVDKGQKLSFYFILTYVLLATLFSQNHLFLALRKTFLFFISSLNFFNIWVTF